MTKFLFICFEENSPTKNVYEICFQMVTGDISDDNTICIWLLLYQSDL